MGRLWELVENLDAAAPTPAPTGGDPRTETLDTFGQIIGAGQVTDSPTDLEARLSELLDTWVTMNEDLWTQEAVDEMKDSIMDVFAEHPREAPGWFAAWRARNPTAKLA
jgi:hypothetical protein